ncbi:MAG: TRAFs-binding domain-containing protein [Pseudomonadales bacterium]
MKHSSSHASLVAAIGTVAEARDYLGLSNALAGLQDVDWEQHRQLRLRLARTLIRKGLARDGLDLLPTTQQPLDIETEQLRAWALANTGAPGTAARYLQQLLDAGHEDSETLGLLGRTRKDMARRADSRELAQRYWREALAHYQRAYALTGDIYPGINAAALLLRTGALTAARELAGQVLKTVNSLLDEPEQSDDWALATRAEALLILGETAAAHSAYAVAAQRLRGDYSALGSTVRQARELLSDLELPADRLESAFALPRVAIFSGHRIDAPERLQPRFPAAQEQQVRTRVDALLAQHNIGVAYGAAANGADLIFMEAVAARGGEIHLVLPMEIETFRAVSVTDGDPDPTVSEWGRRFDQVLAKAASVTIASEHVDLEDPSVFDYGNRVALGTAQLKSLETGTELLGIALWDGTSGLAGGTGDCVALWQQFELPLYCLHPSSPAISTSPVAVVSQQSRKRLLMGMVFADVVGYSALSEQDIERFYEHVLPRVAALGLEQGLEPLVNQTFGDAFYFVFASAPDAAEFALAMNVLFRKELRDFTDLDLRIRIALHAGPLLNCFDPIAGRTNYTGRHTSKTARVEPVAAENQILTTAQFAALLALEAPQQYDLAYAGEQVLPKGYGSERLFVLSAQSEQQ